MDKSRYKKFVTMQVAGLVLLLCGQWPWAMAVFVISHIMSAKPREEVVERAVETEPELAEDDMDDYLVTEESRYKRPRLEQKTCYREPKAKKSRYGDSPNKRSKSKSKPRSKSKGDPTRGLRSSRTMVLEEDGSISKYKPNAFVIRGVQGAPLLCDYDESGKPTDNGVELEVGGWIESLCGPKGMDESSVVLVHAIKGGEGNLVKALQIHEVERKGKSITVAEMAQEGILLDVAESLRESYIEEVS